MVKYRFEFKKIVVKEYLKGLDGYKNLAEKHGIKSYGHMKGLGIINESNEAVFHGE